ncbi:MAG: hypothetical protein V5A46_02985 [Haloferacaceae archaeon]
MELLVRHERGLWLAAVLLYGVGDAVSTFVGLSLGGVAEAGPIAAPAMIGFGHAGLLAVKVAVFLSFLGVWAALRTPARAAVPLALATVGGLATAWNVIVIATAT